MSQLTAHIGLCLRGLREDDYPTLIARVDEWWGRPISHLLPRLFLRHFHATSLAAVDDTGHTVGFLVGIVSPSEPSEAHVHFIAVSSAHRRSGLGSTLYESFFELARKHGCRVVTAVVSPGNTRSQHFHLSVGFEPVPLGTPSLSSQRGGVDAPELPVWKDWDGPGEDRVRFSYSL